MHLKKLIPAAAVLLALALFVFLGGRDRNSGSTEDRDEGEFPDLMDFKAYTLDGEKMTDRDLRSYDVTVINIWSVTCGPCINEMPALAEFSASLPENVGFFTVCLDGESAAERAAGILKQAGYTGITVISGDGDMLRLMDSVMYIPTTIFVDSRGKNVGEAFVGAPRDTIQYYTDALNQALEEVKG